MSADLTNAELARLTAHVADALAGYDHLPELGMVYVSSYDGGSVHLGTRLFGGNNRMRDVATWAAAFDAPVVIDLSRHGDLFTVVDLGGVAARLTESITHQQAYELGAALGIPVSPGGQVQVSAADLVAALDTSRSTTTGVAA